MTSTALKEKAFAFFKDKNLTEKWLETPCNSFDGKTPAEYYESSSRAQQEVEEYLDLLLTKPTK